jgi:hypothetical protein
MRSFVRALRGLAVALTVSVSMAASVIPARAVGYSGEAATATHDRVGGRVFSTGFESISDFDGFYIVPQNYLGTTSHEQSTEQVRSGTYSHKGWMYGANPPSTPSVNNGHRGYPTIQLQNTPGGSFICPCEVTLHVWLDVPLNVPGEWFSFATFTSDPTDDWTPVFVANVSAANPAPGTVAGGVVHLMHVPNTGEREPTFQTSTILFPMRQWVELKFYLDMDPVHGEAKVWQDGQLVSAAPFAGGDGTLAQAHFGMYAAAELASGVVYNDDLEIREVAAQSVGGIAESPDREGAASNRSAESSTPGPRAVVGLAASAVSGVMLLAGAVWYAHKRRVS